MRQEESAAQIDRLEQQIRRLSTKKEKQVPPKAISKGDSQKQVPIGMVPHFMLSILKCPRIIM